jgi:hypothetical protein
MHRAAPAESDLSLPAPAPVAWEIGLRPLSDHVVGLLIISLLPALFWGAIIAFAARVAGVELAPQILPTVCSAIAVFLAGVYAALVLNRA